MRRRVRIPFPSPFLQWTRPRYVSVVANFDPVPVYAPEFSKVFRPRLRPRQQFFEINPFPYPSPFTHLYSSMQISVPAELYQNLPIVMRGCGCFYLARALLANNREAGLGTPVSYFYKATAATQRRWSAWVGVLIFFVNISCCKYIQNRACGCQISTRFPHHLRRFSRSRTLKSKTIRTRHDYAG